MRVRMRRANRAARRRGDAGAGCPAADLGRRDGDGQPGRSVVARPRDGSGTATFCFHGRGVLTVVVQAVVFVDAFTVRPNERFLALKIGRVRSAGASSSSCTRPRRRRSCDVSGMETTA